MEATGLAPVSSHSAENQSPPTSEDDSPPAANFWPNGNSGEDDASLLADGLTRVTLCSSSHQGGQSIFASPNSSAISSVTSSTSYWSNNEESPAFTNGSNYSGYSSGGSSSGSPQSPLTRGSRPITGGGAGFKQASVFYPSSNKDKSVSAWPQKSNPLYGSSFTPTAATPKSALQGNQNKDRSIDWAKGDRMAPGQPLSASHSYGPFASQYRQGSSIGGSRPGGPALSGRVPQQPQAQTQQEITWPTLGAPTAGWGVGQQPLTFHAARKFGRRRGNRTLTTLFPYPSSNCILMSLPLDFISPSLGKSPFFTGVDSEGHGAFDSSSGVESERYSRKVFVGGLPPDIDEGT